VLNQLPYVSASTGGTIQHPTAPRLRDERELEVPLTNGVDQAIPYVYMPYLTLSLLKLVDINENDLDESPLSSEPKLTFLRRLEQPKHWAQLGWPLVSRAMASHIEHSGLTCSQLGTVANLAFNCLSLADGLEIYRASMAPTKDKLQTVYRYDISPLL
jgi:hypothetical protein